MTSMILDYLTYMTYDFLCVFKKYNSDNLKSRTINGVSLILFLFAFLLISCGYMILIKINLLTFNKTVYFILCVSLFLIIYLVIKQKYKGSFEIVIGHQRDKFNYNKNKLILLFSSIWILSLFSFWGGLLLIKIILHW